MVDGSDTRAGSRNISLTVTRKCNLSCVYCYEHSKSAEDMTFECAKNIIDRELIYGKPEEKTYIEFFGGEPFLNFELIKQVYDYVLSFYKGRLHFFATTNGTLIHGDIRRWLEERTESFSLGLSLDGTKTAHDMNRSNSFDDIDLDFFLKKYPQQKVKMTVSEHSLPYFAESVKYLGGLGFDVACNLAHMVDWTGGKNREILIAQLEELIEYYLKYPFIKRCSMLDFKIETLALPRDDELVSKYCGCGTAMVCYDVNGEAYPCQLFAPLSAGERALSAERADIREKFPKSRLRAECRECYFLPLCPICLGSNYLSTGDMYATDKDRCELYKLIFAANAKLKASEWERGLLDYAPEREQALLRSVLEILK